LCQTYLFWSREYNSAKEICKYPSFSKVGDNYPLDLKIILSSGLGLWCLMPLSTIFLLDRGGQFYYCTKRKPLTCRKLLTNLFTYSCIEYTTPSHEQDSIQNSPFDFYNSSEKNSEKSSFQINNFFSRCLLIYDRYEYWQLISKFLDHY
jgi:hypothetical protein